MITATVEVRHAGEPLGYSVEFFDRAWDEFPELQCTPKDEWVCTSVETVIDAYRLELVVLSDSKPIGGCILVPDYDGHVGNCLSVMFNYVLPEYRAGRVGAVLLRTALQLTRRLGYPVLAYSHRKGDWEYSIRYRRVRNEE